MANEKRLIDANALVPYLWALFKFFGSIPCTEADKATQRGIKRCIGEIKKMPTVDAVEVDEIRVDIMRLCLENQEAILNVSICGKPNEVKLPFSKEVVEVVHGRWENPSKYGLSTMMDKLGNVCSACASYCDNRFNYCPHCGAKMDGV